MAKIESYECDRCGHTQPRDRQFPGPENPRWMYTIDVTMRGGDQPTYGSVRLENNETHRAHVLWCGECVEAIRLNKLGIGKPVDSVVAAQTLDDVLREIVREELRSAAQS